MGKFTKSSLKKFVRENINDFYIWVSSSFSGMTDCVEQRELEFVKVDPSKVDFDIEHDWWINWLRIVGESNDSFNIYDKWWYFWYEIFNCCWKSILAIKK